MSSRFTTAVLAYMSQQLLQPAAKYKQAGAAIQPLCAAVHRVTHHADEWKQLIGLPTALCLQKNWAPQTCICRRC